MDVERADALCVDALACVTVSYSSSATDSVAWFEWVKAVRGRTDPRNVLFFRLRRMVRSGTTPTAQKISFPSGKSRGKSGSICAIISLLSLLSHPCQGFRSPHFSSIIHASRLQFQPDYTLGLTSFSCRPFDLAPLFLSLRCLFVVGNG